MLITKIERQKQKENRYSVFIDNEFAFGIEEIDLLYYKLKENETIDEKKYNTIINSIILDKAKNVATRYLSYKMRSEKQIIKKLEEENFSSEVINKVIALLKKYNYVNDYEFAKAFFKDKMQISKHGSIKIKSDLKICGVNSKIINKIFEENEIDESEIAFELLKKKTFRKIDKKLDFKEKNKLVNYLLRRGFPYDTVKIALDKFLLENDF